jgi:hypothetical protein
MAFSYKYLFSNNKNKSIIHSSFQTILQHSSLQNSSLQNKPLEEKPLEEKLEPLKIEQKELDISHFYENSEDFIYVVDNNANKEIDEIELCDIYNNTTNTNVHIDNIDEINPMNE